MSNEKNLNTLLAEIEALKAANAKLVAEKAAKSVITLKVSDKGGVSVYGLQRMPVTLYSNQWTRLLAKADEIKQFIVDNADDLSVKPAKE